MTETITVFHIATWMWDTLTTHYIDNMYWHRNNIQMGHPAQHFQTCSKVSFTLTIAVLCVRIMSVFKHVIPSLYCYLIVLIMFWNSPLKRWNVVIHVIDTPVKYIAWVIVFFCLDNWFFGVHFMFEVCTVLF